PDHGGPAEPPFDAGDRRGPQALPKARRQHANPAQRASRGGAELREAHLDVRPELPRGAGLRRACPRGREPHARERTDRARRISLMARSGLGRGLDVLLGSQPTSVATMTPATTEIPLERIAPNPQQPRTQFDHESIDQLAASISRHGVLQPVVVSRKGDSFELIAGHRRVLASRAAGKTTIPAVIRDDVNDRLELALVENLQRADLNAIETARAYKLLMETYDLTQEQLAERVGKSRPHVANTLRALTAPQVLQDAVLEGKISEG